MDRRIAAQHVSRSCWGRHLSLFATVCLAFALVLVAAPGAARAANWFTASTIGVREADDQVNNAWGVAVAANGTVYVAETGSHVIKMFGPTGTPLGSFGEFGHDVGQLWAPRDLAVAPDGSVYVSDTYNHRIQRFSATGVPLGAYGHAGAGALEFSQPLGISVAPDGTVYVADEGNSRIQHLAADGQYLGSWGTAGAGPGQFSGPTAIAVTPDGSVYVAEHYGNRLQKFTANGVHVWTVGSLGGGLGQMNGPVNMDAAPDGSVVMVEVWGGRVQRFAPDGTPIAAFGNGGPNGLASPRGIAVAPDGSVVVADTAADRIRRFDAGGSLVATWGRPMNDPGQLVMPSSIARAADGTLWVVEPSAQRISHFSPSGTFLGSFGSGGAGPGQFSWPHDVAIAPDGTLYVTDYWNNRVQRFTSGGTFVSSFGSTGAALGQLVNPDGIAIAADGTVVVVDRGNGRVQRFSAAGVAINTIGSPGTLSGQLSAPHQVGVLADGTILVGEDGTNRVQRFSPAGAPLSVIGGPGAAPGQFNGPLGLGELPGGDIVVAEVGGRRIQRFSSAGAYGSSYASVTELGQPSAASVDPDGSLWVSDTAKQRIEHLVWDSVPPVASIATSSGDDEVTFSAAVSDTGSGPATAAWSWDGGATWGTSANHTVRGLGLAGIAEIDFVARDAAGNLTSVSATATSLPDRTPPVIALQTPVAAPLGRGARLRFEFSDNSRLVIARTATWRGVPVPFVGDEVDLSGALDGPGIVQVIAHDVSGNASTWSGAVTLDFTAPSITSRSLRSVLGQGARVVLDIGAGEAHAVDTNATFQGRPVPVRGGVVDMRGVADGLGWLRVTARDAAGNARTWQRRIRVDGRAPAIRGDGVTRTLGRVATLAASDGGSGVAGAVRCIAPKLGRNLVRATAVDRAGNRSHRNVVVERHLALSAPRLNADLGRVGIDAESTSVVDVFAFAGPVAPWYVSRAESPPLVREVQWRLQRFGYLSLVTRRTGVLDLPTIRAIQRFQAAHELPVLGTVGPRTRRLLDAEFRKHLAYVAA